MAFGHGRTQEKMRVVPFRRERSSLGTNPPENCRGRRGADTLNVGTPQMGLTPLRWKQVLPLEIPAIASTRGSSHVAKNVLGPCLVLCPLHEMASEVFSENRATEPPSHMSRMSREPSACKPPCQPYLALPTNLWQAQLVSTSGHLQSCC